MGSFRVGIRTIGNGLQPIMAMITRGVVALAVLAAACSSASAGPTLAAMQEESILQATIPGLTAKRIAEERGGANPGLTQLMEVSGSWEAASVQLAVAVEAHGWTIQAINCVGTGNDVIAKKLIEGQWVLLESGAGTRAAGIILSLDSSQQPPGSLDLDSHCSAALITAVS